MKPAPRAGRPWQRAGCILLLLLPAALVARAATEELEQVVGKPVHREAPAVPDAALR